MTQEAREYIASTPLKAAIRDCVNQVLHEKPQDALLRMSELLAAWPDSSKEAEEIDETEEAEETGDVAEEEAAPAK